MGKIRDISTIISVHEGFPIEGSIAQRNKNPGNIIFGDLARRHGATTFWKHPKTGHEFAIFPTVEDGFKALDELITNACTGKSKIYSPDWTILQFFTKYSPVRDDHGNVIPNVNYASDVAKRLGVSMYTKIKDLLESQPIPENVDVQPQEVNKPMFTQFNQLDYQTTYLGNTKYTVARWGCLSLVINMGYNFLFGKNVQPPEMVKILTYDSNGNLQWPSIKKIGLLLVSAVRKSPTPYDMINTAYKNPNQFVALELNNGAHFVWLAGRYLPLLGYRIVDPFRGIITYTKLKSYNITGCRIIERN